MVWSEEDVELVPVAWLKAHEEIKPRNKEKLLEMTKRWGGFTKPLVVDQRTGVILDGHHRYHVSMNLNLARVPAICVDYVADDRVTVTVWPACGRTDLTKEEVLSMGLSNDVFPPKTSRHSMADDLPPIHVSLERLALLQDECP